MEGHTRRPAGGQKRPEICGKRAKVTENKNGQYCQVRVPPCAGPCSYLLKPRRTASIGSEVTG